MRKASSTIKFFTLFVSVTLITGIFSTTACAQEKSLEPKGAYYEFDEKDNYSVDEKTSKVKTSASNTIGVFSISGDFKDQGNDIYYIQSGNVDVSYRVDWKNLETDAKKWHLTVDKNKIVNGNKLDSELLKGVIIVESSLDGKEWLIDKTITNAFSGEVDLSTPFFTTKDLHQLNGCFYRVIIAYKLEKQVDSSMVLLWEKENYEYKKIAEVYSFFVINQSTVDSGAASPDDKPRREFSDVLNTGKDTGYDLYSAKVMDKDDPHFHKSIGYFTVNGFTRETTDSDGTPVFLKTIGDEVTLWFSLTEDIDKLFGNEKLSISEDKNGYDKAMVGAEQTNFKHGALLVKYTNEEGHSNEAVTYVDFLKANTMTGADTRIQLYEEGDYEVALDYEIRVSKAIPEYRNYKIYFNFSIRNGNTMAFPRDCKTGSELKDGAWTADGFTIDLAESKYLTIDFTRREVVQGADGTISTSVRDNKVGKEGAVYSKNGIYEITVKNQYSDGKPTTVTLYVGNDKNILALARTKMTVVQLNELINNGYTIDDDGSLISPEKPAEETTIDNIPAETAEPVPTPPDIKPLVVDTPSPQEESAPASTAFDETELQAETAESDTKTAPIVLICIGSIIVVGLIILYIKKEGFWKERK